MSMQILIDKLGAGLDSTVDTGADGEVVFLLSGC